MGLFVLTSSDSVIDRLKAALENLKLEERLQGDHKSYLVSDFAIPYLESVIRDLEEDVIKGERPRPDWFPKNIQLPKTSRITTESIDPRCIKDPSQVVFNTYGRLTTTQLTELPNSSSKICVDCGRYHFHGTKHYTVSLCKSCEDNRIGLEMDE